MDSHFKEKYFYSAVGFYLLVGCYLGFSTTLSIRLETSTVPFNVIFHGIASGLWLSLYLAQSLLIDFGNRKFHRNLGLGGVLLLCVVLASGSYTILSKNPSLDNYYSQVGRDFVLILSAVIAAAFGILNRRNPFFHKRLMFFSAVMLSTAGMTRAPLFFDMGRPGLVGLALLLIPLLALNLYDFVRTKKVYVTNIAILIAFFFVILSANSPFLWESAFFHSIVNSLAGAIAS